MKWFNRKKYFRLSVNFVNVFFVSSALAESDVARHASALSQWSINGSTTLRVEAADVNGNSNASPYSNTGGQQFADFSVNLSRQFSPYETLRAQLVGTVNNSENRATNGGVFLERGNLTWEKGDGAMPFRFDAGDFFGNQSRLTLQRGLKGVQLDLQPSFAGDSSHSIQLFSGVAGTNYRALTGNEDLYHGASWLMSESGYGNFLFTAVNNITKATTTNPELLQNVYSVAWEMPMPTRSQLLNVEVEYAAFEGDHTVFGTAEFNQQDYGFSSQVSGRDKKHPLTYRVVHERYGDDFQPKGASISSNQRSSEAHVGWQFDSGINLRSRLQTFRTNWKSTNPTDRDVAGISLSGPFVPSIKLAGTFNSFVANSEALDSTSRSLTHSNSGSLSMPIAPNWFANMNASIIETDNRITGVESASKRASFGLGHDFETNGFKGSFFPSINFSRSFSSGTKTQSNATPSLSFNLSNDRHNFSFSHSLQQFESKSLTGTDSNTKQTSLNYTFTKDAHRLLVETNYYHRSDSTPSKTNANRIGISWTYNFDRPAKVPQQTSLLTYASSDRLNKPTMLELAPGNNFADTLNGLSQVNIVQPLERNEFAIFETPILDSIELIQRLVLVKSGNELEASVLVIEFSDSTNKNTTQQNYEVVRKLLFDRYGAPINFVEEGEFSSNLSNDLRLGRFTRFVDWQTNEGIIRFGIPARIDGKVRMEVIHADSFASGDSNLWSINKLP